MLGLGRKLQAGTGRSVGCSGAFASCLTLPRAPSSCTKQALSTVSGQAVAQRRGSAGWLLVASPSWLCRAAGGESSTGGHDHGRQDHLAEYLEVKVDSVRVATGAASIVYLRILDTENLVLPVHIGENESSALLKEINKQRQQRPLTHDVARNLLSAIGYRVTKIRITDVVANTYYARIHLARVNAQGIVEGDEVDVDARPSDAINLAVRFGAPMYVNKRIAESATTHPNETFIPQGSESQNEIVRSVRDTLASFEDPCIMLQLQKDLAIQEQRYEDAHALQQSIYYEMTHSPFLRLVVAMEAALSDGRYEEAARLRDEYRKLSLHQVPSSSVDKGR